jgi:SAM-dependent methyltransferase
MSASPQVQCRQCLSADLLRLGDLPDAASFAGQQLNPPWSGGALYQCKHCYLGFRHPILPIAEYERLYSRASADVWVTSSLRNDQLRVLALIESHSAGGRVLDVGCYDGTLLNALKPDFEKYGVEPSVRAAEVARRRGVKVVARTVGELEGLSMNFNVICAIDVIEHVANPSDFIQCLLRRLATGGLLIISSGTLDCPAWRQAGGRYWYCSFPEHISFISESWASGLAASFGLSISFALRFQYQTLGPISQIAARAMFNAKLALLARQGPVGSHFNAWLGRRAASGVLAHPGVFDDHLVLAFAKAIR